MEFKTVSACKPGITAQVKDVLRRKSGGKGNINIYFNRSVYQPAFTLKYLQEKKTFYDYLQIRTFYLFCCY